MYHEITEQERSNLKAVLFGNQKQANVINDSVVRIVAEMLCDLTNDNILNSEESIVTGIKDVLEECVQEYITVKREFILLTAGEQSLANLELENTPLVVDVEQPNPESPKHNFRILVLGADTSELGNDIVNAGSRPVDLLNDDTPGQMVDRLYDKLNEYAAAKVQDINVRHGETPTEIVDKLIKELAPLCPTGPAAELNDDVKAALYVTKFMN